MLERSSAHTITAVKIREQIALLKRSQNQARPLNEMMAEWRWSYDDLIYRNSRALRWRGNAPLALDDLRCKKHGVPLVSFFTGCGGMDLGFEAAGYEHVAAFELNDLFCKTLRRNRPDWRVFGPPYHSGDVSDFESVSRLLNELIKTPFDGIFVGGPPCQPFSIAANQRFSKSGDNFKRTGFAHEKNGNLLFDFIRLIEAFKPKAFVIENVPGLRDIDNGEQLAAATRRLEDAGYNVQAPMILDAAYFGIPQQRIRLFVVGTRSEKRFLTPIPHKELVGCGSVLELSIKDLPNNEIRDHQPESIRRYMELDYGERDQLGRVDRLNPALPSKTVIAGGSGGGGRSHLHPEIPRTLSVRECARLQTFPDDFIFLGPTARQFTQVGNAVPPVLAAQVARQIMKSFF
jgi:DNA (cytosine-5)-methyltransferase 1